MGTTVLRTQDLSKHYDGLIAVDDLSLDVCQGEIFGLLGPNGAGKTTTINMMCGLLEPDAGVVIIQGKQVHGRDKEICALVGMCPQIPIYWEKLTPIEQLEFIGEMYAVPRKIARQRGEVLLEILGLGGKRDEPAFKLSGGMVRRLNLALALIHDPEILVLDEPEAGLDPQSRVLVREYIRSLARQKTIILTTHNMDEADRMADRVAIIDHGRLLVLDTPERLKRTIGEGDTLELAVSGIPTDAILATLRPIFPNANALEGKLTIQAKEIVGQVPFILNTLQVAGAHIGEVHLRPNTLEDVFIALTGRRLRE